MQCVRAHIGEPRADAGCALGDAYAGELAHERLVSGLTHVEHRARVTARQVEIGGPEASAADVMARRAGAPSRRRGRLTARGDDDVEVTLFGGLLEDPAQMGRYR